MEADYGQTCKCEAEQSHSRVAPDVQRTQGPLKSSMKTSVTASAARKAPNKPTSSGFCCCKKKISVSEAKRSVKPFHTMTPQEKTDRIKYLWTVARKQVQKLRYIYRVNKMNEERAVNELEGVEASEEQLEQLKNKDVKVIKWYIIEPYNFIPQLWEFIINTMTIYTFVAVPLVMVYQDTLFFELRVIEIIIDFIFIFDILFTFFKAYYDNGNILEISLKKIWVNYMTTYLIFDIAGNVPGLVTFETNPSIHLLKYARFVHWGRIFKQLNLFFDKVVFGVFGVNKQKIKEIMELLKIMIFVFVCTHLFACIWILLGLRPGGWVEQNSGDFSPENKTSNYIFAFYWIIETITTVGYGDYSGSNTDEIIFTMFLEFYGLSFFSFLIGSISNIFSNGNKFEDLIDQKMDNLDLWIRKLESAKRDKKIPTKLYYQIKKYVQDAFVHDFNSIIEEYDFYFQMPPHLQSDVVKCLFKDFTQKFDKFFERTDQGFQNELIVNLYCRIFPPDYDIISYGEQPQEIFFIKKGGVKMCTEAGKAFCVLPEGSWIGDYQVVFNLKSNIAFRSIEAEKGRDQDTSSDTLCMGIQKDVFQKILEMFPKSEKKMKKMAIERRFQFMKHLEKFRSLDSKKNGKEARSPGRRTSVVSSDSFDRSQADRSAIDDMYEFGDDEKIIKEGDETSLDDIGFKISHIKKKVNTITEIISKVDSAMAKNLMAIKKSVDPRKSSGAKKEMRELALIAKDGWEKYGGPPPITVGDQSPVKKPANRKMTKEDTIDSSKKNGRRDTQNSNEQPQASINPPSANKNRKDSRKESRGNKYKSNEEEIDDLLDELDLDQNVKKAKNK